MKRSLTPLVVGAFVLGGLLLAAVALVSFGASQWFGSPTRFVVLVQDRTVSGLDPGAPVKISGVRVGRVDTLTPRIDPETGRLVVRIVCSMNEGVAESLMPTAAAVDRDSPLTPLVAQGLRGKLNLSGITGLLYLDLVMPEGANGAVVEYDEATGAPIVPLAPSLFAEFTESFSELTTNLAQVDFAALARELHALLATTTQAITDANFAETTDRIARAATAVEALANDEHLRTGLRDFAASAGDLHEMLGHLREGTPGLRDDLTAVLQEAAKALQTLRESAATVQALFGPRSGLSGELSETFERVQRAADSIEQLADLLQRNPSALVRGRTIEPAPAASTPP